MFIKKILNNNKGADLALIGTSYLLVLIMMCAAAVDMFIMFYAKQVTITTCKQCEIYALAKQYDYIKSWMVQSLPVTNQAKEDITQEFRVKWDASGISSTPFMTVSLDTKNDVFCVEEKSEYSLILSATRIITSPRTLYKASGMNILNGKGKEENPAPPVGNLSSSVHTNANAHNIISVVQTKVAFIPQ